MPLPIAGAMVIGAGLSAAGSMLGNYFSGTSARRNQQLAYEQQRRLMQEQFGLQQQYADYAFNKETAYNSPVNQRKLLQEAGFNPFAMASEQGIGKSVPADYATPVGSIPSVPAFQATPNAFSGISDIVASLAKAYSDISSGRNKDSETQYNLQSLGDRLRSANAIAESDELNAKLRQLDVVANSLTQVPQAQALLNKTYEEIVQLQVGNRNTSADTILKNLQSDILQVEKSLRGEQLIRFRQETPLFIENLRSTLELIEEQKKTEKSKQASNYANVDASRASAFSAIQQGNYYGALTQTENALRDSKVRLVDNEARQKYYDCIYLFKTLGARVKNTKLMPAETRAKINELCESAWNLRQSGDHATFGEIDKLYKGAKDVAKDLGLVDLLKDIFE